MSARRYETEGLSLGALIGIAIAILVVVLGIGYAAFGGYILHGVDQTEVGVKFQSNKIVDIVGAGLYSDFTPFAKMKNVDVSGIPFQVEDKEVLTKDKQRIGVKVTGTVHRPNKAKADVLLEKWSQYSTFYLDNHALAGKEITTKDQEGKETKVWEGGLMESLGQQAQKVCVGDLNFDQAVIGSARDVLRECINTELDKLSAGYGLEVNNIVVPQIILSPEVQAQLDAITKARFDTQIAQQQTEKAKADGERELMTQQAAIRVEQGRIQEKALQDARTAELTQKALAAERAVIEQRKSNELFTAEQDLLIQLKQQEVAAARAKADLANQTALAAIYQNNPLYTELEKTKAQASAYKETDKVIITGGTDPFFSFGSQAPTPVTSIDR